MIKIVLINDIELICKYKLKMFEDSGHIDLLHENAKVYIT